MINIFQPQLGKEELEAIKNVFDSNWIGKGKLTFEFEKKFADFLNTTYQNIRSTNCCTEGLFLSMQLFNIQPGDEIIMPTISFVGAGNAVCAINAKPVFCDVDKRTLNVRVQDIEKKITKKTKAIILIHYAGVPCDMDKIMNLAKANKLYVIEDSACSISSTYKSKPCGTIGDMGMWSFDAMKILVCGDGSMLYLKDEELAGKAEKLMYFGLENKSGFSNSVDSKWWEFELSCYGHRSIMNDITAAMALEQLKKLPNFINARKRIHNIYSELLKQLSWIDLPPEIPSYCTSSYYFYHIQVNKNIRDKLAIFLRENGVYSTFRYYPLHWVKYYGIDEKLENAEDAANTTLCIPIHHSLSDNDIDVIISKIKEFGRINHC